MGKEVKPNKCRGQMLAREFHGQYLFVYRPSYHEALRSAYCSSTGRGPPIELKLNAKVVHWDPDTACADLKNGARLRGDLLITVDGIHSCAHVHVVGKEKLAIINDTTSIRFVIPNHTIEEWSEGGDYPARWPGMVRMIVFATQITSSIC